MLPEEPFFDSEREILSVLRDRGFSPNLIVDIGASDGAWTRGCLNVFPNSRYRLYEPLYSHLDHYKAGLDKLIEANSRIHLRPVALAETAQVADFFITPHSVGSSLLPLAEARKIEIEVTTLDRELEHVSEPIDILKMDTQGGELRILKGAKSIIPRTHVIIVESWLYRGYGPPTPLAHELIEELLRYDFRVFGMGAPYFSPENILYALDLYFGNPKMLSLLGSHPFRKK